MSTKPDLHKSLVYLKDIGSKVENKELSKLLDYWISIHPTDRLPARSDFDPTAVARHLANMILVDVEREPLRYRVRVHGTNIVWAMKTDFTGQYLNDFMRDFDKSSAARERLEVVTECRPVYSFGSANRPFALPFVPTERLHLPMASDGQTPDQVLSTYCYRVDREKKDLDFLTLSQPTDRFLTKRRA